MYIAFDQMPESARVWIYQSREQITDEAVIQIEKHGKDFCESWDAHGQPLKSSLKVLHNRFVIITVDESFNVASGCSIDRSVRLVQEIEQAFGLSLFDRTHVAFLKGNEVLLKPLNGIKNEISAGVIAEDTVTFNNLVQNLGEMRANWKVPVGESWLKRYFA
ncbi:MAG: hypothetical protein AAFO69_08510 [Bacteroidota bacterium]